jgi:hypothetical protein
MDSDGLNRDELYQAGSINQVCLPEWLKNTIAQFTLVKACRRLRAYCDLHGTSQIGQIRNGVPGGEKLVPIGRKCQLDRLFNRRLGG